MARDFSPPRAVAPKIARDFIFIHATAAAAELRGEGARGRGVHARRRCGEDQLERGQRTQLRLQRLPAIATSPERGTSAGLCLAGSGNSEAGAATFYASARGEKGMQREVAFIDHLREYTKAYKSAVAMFVRSL